MSYINVRKTYLSTILNYKLVYFYIDYPFFIRKRKYFEQNAIVEVDVQKENLVSNIHFLNWLNDQKDQIYIYDFIENYSDNNFRDLVIPTDMIIFLKDRLYKYISLYPKNVIEFSQHSFLLNTEDAVSIDMLGIYNFLFYLEKTDYLYDINLRCIRDSVFYVLENKKNPNEKLEIFEKK